MDSKQELDCQCNNPKTAMLVVVGTNEELKTVTVQCPECKKTAEMPEDIFELATMH